VLGAGGEGVGRRKAGMARPSAVDGGDPLAVAAEEARKSDLERLQIYRDGMKGFF
jgi:hypothetical protein